jgi:hypothetical protein
MSKDKQNNMIFNNKPQNTASKKKIPPKQQRISEGLF